MRRSTAVLLALGWLLAGCQYDDRCGDDDLVYRRGLCFAPEPDAATPPPASDAGDDAGDDAPCEGTCELFGRCIAENAQASGLLGAQLTMLGFAGTDPSGCVAHCDENRGGPSDDDVLACFAGENERAVCDASMLAGALPAVEAVNTCCQGRAESAYCVALCSVLQTNALAYGMVPSCSGVIP